MSTSMSSEAITDRQTEHNNCGTDAYFLKESLPSIWYIYLEEEPRILSFRQSDGHLEL